MNEANETYPVVSEEQAEKLRGQPLIVPGAVSSQLAGLAVGRIVHYVREAGVHRAAIVTGVPGLIAEGPAIGDSDQVEDVQVIKAEAGSGVVSLTVFTTLEDGAAFELIPGAPFDPTGETPETWHWPERA
jgi:hypothetical protein